MSDIVGTAYFARTHVQARVPEYKSDLASGVDLYVVEDFTLLPRQQEKMPTGLIAIPPKGYYWKLYLRSSAANRYPGLCLVNSVGIIDEDYQGPQDEIGAFLGNRSRDMIHVIKRGDRVLQLVLEKRYRADIKEIPHAELQNRRSRGGFGSTGK